MVVIKAVDGLRRASRQPRYDDIPRFGSNTPPKQLQSMRDQTLVEWPDVMMMIMGVGL